MLNNKSILITGGTGSFGKEFVKTVYKKYPKIKKLIIFSRDEFKQSEMAKLYPEKSKSIRFFLGDVRDRERLERAARDVDIIVHAAALKQVPAAEYNPMEFVKTNIIGASNVIEAAISCNVKQVIALSTDKAASPINLYGATKLCSDKLFIAANLYAGYGRINFSVVRYGNVMNSRGSVIPLFMNMKKNNVLSITHKDMTRFNITLNDGVNFVLKCLKMSKGGEIFVPKIPSYKITDIAKAIAPHAKIKIIGTRRGEKIDEELVTSSDSKNTLESKNHFIIINDEKLSKYYQNKFKCKKVKKGFSYNSRENKFLSISDLKKLINNF